MLGVKFMLVITRKGVRPDLHTSVYTTIIYATSLLQRSGAAFKSATAFMLHFIIYGRGAVCWQVSMKPWMLWHISKPEWMKSN